MILFLKLLLAHLIGDFLLQFDSWVTDKQTRKHRSPMLYAHVLVHLLLYIGAVLTTGLEPLLLLSAFLLAGSHLVIDIAKLHLSFPGYRNMVFFADQLLHFLCILLLANHFEPFVLDLLNHFGKDLLLLQLTSIALLTFVSSQVIKVLISQWTPVANQVQHSGDLQEQHRAEEESALPNAGSYIGMLERLFIFGFMISGNLAGIGFLITAKSVFRFGEIRDSRSRKLTEYILIGTLLSFGIAILIGYFYLEMKKYLRN